MRFEKGQSRNPAGRPPGWRNQATIVAETMLQSEAEVIVRMAIDGAKEGDITAIRLCPERVFPRLRDRATLFDLPQINNAPEALDALTSIVEGLRGGELTAAEGCELSKLVDHYLRALEAKDFETRLKMLEAEPRRAAATQPMPRRRAVPRTRPPVPFPVINRKNRRNCTPMLRHETRDWRVAD
jgi:hypothetical protein